MILSSIRYNKDSNSTQAILRINGEFECHVLEDEERCVKLSGETAIPEGTYKIEQRKELTPLTERYRNRFDWFNWHLQILEVPNFEWVYIHIGNTELDTEGCLLLGDIAVNDPTNQSSTIQKSVQAYKRFYNKVCEALESGEQVWIQIQSI